MCTHPPLSSRLAFWVHRCYDMDVLQLNRALNCDYFSCSARRCVFLGVNTYLVLFLIFNVPVTNLPPSSLPIVYILLLRYSCILNISLSWVNLSQRLWSVSFWILLSMHLPFLYPRESFHFIYLFIWERGREGRKIGTETSMCERYIDWLPLTHPQLWTWPTTLACAMTGNWTGDLVVCRLVLNLLEPHQPGLESFHFIIVSFTFPFLGSLSHFGEEHL